MTNKLSVAYLESLCQDGWWPYVPGHGEAMESTCWCAIACRKNSKLAAATIKHLLASQNPDGGWTTAQGIGESDWSTGTALLTLGILAKELGATNTAGVQTAMQNGFKKLTAERTDMITDLTRIGMMVMQGPDFDYARGWPWEPDTYHWVEPTSYAILAIKASPYAREKRYQNIVTQAFSYMLEKTCSGGGWNFGAPNTLGTDWPAAPGPTAMALMAIHGNEALSQIKVEQALSYLQKLQGPTIDTTLADALSIIARDLYGQDTAKETQAIAKRFNAGDHLSTNLCSIAAAVIAGNLNSQGNPFRFSQN